MVYNPNKPTTVSNCPTRAALERKPGDPGFLTESIHARHSEASHNKRAENLAARAAASQRKANAFTKAAK